MLESCDRRESAANFIKRHPLFRRKSHQFIFVSNLWTATSVTRWPYNFFLYLAIYKNEKLRK